MVAIVVILAATISVFVLGFGEDIQEPAPTVAQSSGELTTQEGYDGGIVRITHLAGDSVDVENIEITVDATGSCGETARIVNLPSEAVNFGFEGFSDENLQNGDDSFISKGTFSSTWDAGVLHKTNDNTFSAGSSFEFRIAGGECVLDQGDEVTVRVIHIPSNAIIIKKDLTA
jgi:FlaG/FlaF family flagellin (archaellin)